MNRLPRAKRAAVIHALCEGMSMRAITRTHDVSLNTITKLLIDAGDACLHHHGKSVKNLRGRRRVQVDEIWSFVYAKERVVPCLTNPPPGAGDAWTWTALDADSKLLISWAVGPRTQRTATTLMLDLRRRMTGRIQLTTDGLQAYVPAVERAYGGDIDFSQLVKGFGGRSEAERLRAEGERRYSPPAVTSAHAATVSGSPDPVYVSTSLVERHNLTMRSHMRRFTRLTNGFSKKLENHGAMIAVYVTYYNWIRLHKTLRVTPAMAAGLTDELYDMDWLVGLVEARTPPPGPQGRYRRRGEGGASGD